MGPAIFSLIQEQNAAIRNGTSQDSKAIQLSLGTIGIMNGCIDVMTEGAGYPEMAFNNTYGIQVYNQTVYEAAKAELNRPGDGCLALIQACRQAGEVGDPQHLGTNDTVNQICVAATNSCFGLVQGAYTSTSNVSRGRGT
jgi:hypothetical protein